MTAEQVIAELGITPEQIAHYRRLYEVADGLSDEEFSRCVDQACRDGDSSTEAAIRIMEQHQAKPATTFRSKNLLLVERAVDILGAEQPMTLRQLYYRLVSAGVLRNDQKEYKRLGGVMTRIREDGQVPRSWIVDHVRTTLKPSSWTGLADYAETVRGVYRKDFWASLPHHVEIFVEKDAVAGTIQPVTEANDIRLRVCRGYSSVSFAGEIADLWAKVEKPIFAYYLGDFDPSGFDLERDLREKLERYSGRVRVFDPEQNDYDSFCWQRLAVRQEDFELHNLVCLPVKEKDRRASAFMVQHGSDCAEVDALPPTELRRRVEEAIDSHIDADRWNRLLEVEKLEQQTLSDVVKNWGKKTNLG
jgi:hypothetical protein